MWPTWTQQADLSKEAIADSVYNHAKGRSLLDQDELVNEMNVIHDVFELPMDVTAKAPLVC